MSIWFRASKVASVQATFSGDGGLFTAGRWNHLGRKVIYCSESISLCTLEWLAHHGLSVSGFSYFRFSIEVPDKLIANFTPSDLPNKWDLTPCGDMSRDFAEDKLFNVNDYLAISVPSVIVPEERNLIINPLHSHFHGIFKEIVSLGEYSAPARN